MNQINQSQIAQSTFVATIRTDIRMIASIAKLMESDGNFVGTTGKVASEAIRILSSMSQKVFPVNTYEEAILELRRMRYNDPVAKGTRHYTAIQKKLGFEQSSQKATDELMPIVKELMNRGMGQTQRIPQAMVEERAIANLILRPVEEESEPAIRERKLEKATKGKPTSVPEWTEEDEQADLRKQKDLFIGAPLLTDEEKVNAVDKPDQNQDQNQNQNG